MIDAGWLYRLPLIGNLPPNEAATKLREISEDDTADAMIADSRTASTTYDFRPRFGSRRDRAYLNTAHTIGYLAPLEGPKSNLQPIRYAANITPDDSLRDTGSSSRSTGYESPTTPDVEYTTSYSISQLVTKLSWAPSNCTSTQPTGHKKAGRLQSSADLFSSACG